MRSREERAAVAGFVAAGLNDCEIERRTGVPRRTVLDWRRRGPDVATARCGAAHRFEELPVEHYGYLLGLYLGDGCLSAAPRGVYRLRIVLDSAYPEIVARCAEAIEGICPGKSAHVLRRRDGNCVQVSAWWKHWPCFFPQHGPGPKHARPIALDPWQRLLVERDRRAFVRGLIHSDGCRFKAVERKGGTVVRTSIRYGFSNRSDDIKDLFCESLDALGIRWTRTAREVIVARMASVAVLDEFVGPKA
jgi:hypothetical protein